MLPSFEKMKIMFTSGTWNTLKPHEDIRWTGLWHMKWGWVRNY